MASVAARTEEFKTPRTQAKIDAKVVDSACDDASAMIDERSEAKRYKPSLKKAGKKCDVWRVVSLICDGIMSSIETTTHRCSSSSVLCFQ